ncbi:hypothetical protein DNAM_690 [Pseudomonas phage BroderSalsa]|nr:hypothetical protein DNAM_690 [Pseudomonas phage BroderSalsa]
MHPHHAAALKKSRRRVNLVKHEVGKAKVRVEWSRENYIRQPTPWRLRVIQENIQYLESLLNEYLEELAIGIAVENALRNA